MVSFICDACGNSVRKNQVEKHYQNACRNCSVLSCIDCGVDFPGDSYATHTSCITEAEKYQGHLYQAKDKENKGDAKQKEWLKHVHGTSGTTTDPRLKNLLDRLSAYSNIPRKRKKFDNFCKNSVNVYDTKTLDQLWDLFNTKPAAEEAPKTAAAPPADKKPAVKEDSDNDSDSDSEDGTKKGDTKKEEDTKKDDAKTPKEIEESEESKKKKKKKKDKKSTLDEKVEASDTKENETEKDTNETPVENGNEVEENPTKKKKKNKRKLVEEDCNNNENINGTAEVNGTDGKENKKKKKGKKHKINGTVETEEVSCKKKKKNEIEVIDNTEEKQDTEEESAPQEKFHWHKVIKTVVKQSEDNEISIKKLRKKVLAAYQEHGLDHRASTIDESLALFDKKLKTYPKVKIAKNIVKLVK